MVVDKMRGLRSVTDYSLVLYTVNRRVQQLRLSPVASLVSLTLDMVLGAMVISYLSTWSDPWSHHWSLSQAVFTGMETIIMYLKALIVWMMENPGGLKLNSVLSQALGNFFLYHIHLWMTYVMLIVPMITPSLSNILSVLQYSGLSLQLASLSDLILILTIHIHCFYAYARRLAVSQYRGLLALWRLFLGKKYNPLRDRVDSADNNVEQLFLGTIIFTILLFLMPTTATFFAVFLILKLLATGVTFILRKAITVIQYVPNFSITK